VAEGSGNPAIAWVAGSIRPTSFPAVNQTPPSGPAVIPPRELVAEGSGNSAIAWVIGSIRPIWFPAVNQTPPSGPVVMAYGP
jgi:hypothetical protein